MAHGLSMMYLPWPQGLSPEPKRSTLQVKRNNPSTDSIPGRALFSCVHAETRETAFPQYTVDVQCSTFFFFPFFSLGWMTTMDSEVRV